MKKNVVCQRHAGASQALGVKYDGTFLELLESLLLCNATNVEYEYIDRG